MRTLLLLAFSASILLADGPGVIAQQHAGPWRVTLLAVPFPLRTGPVTIKLIVQSSSAPAYVADADMRLVAQSPAGQEIPLQAVDGTYRWNMASAGVWHLTVSIAGGSAKAHFAVNVAASDGAVSVQSYIAWIAPVPIGIALMAIRQLLMPKSPSD